VDITVALFDRAGLLPGLGRAIPRMSREEMQERGWLAHGLVRDATSRGSGVRCWRQAIARTDYASQGVRFREWFEIFAHFQSLLCR